MAHESSVGHYCLWGVSFAPIGLPSPTTCCCPMVCLHTEDQGTEEKDTTEMGLKQQPKPGGGIEERGLASWGLRAPAAPDPCGAGVVCPACAEYLCRVTSWGSCCGPAEHLSMQGLGANTAGPNRQQGCAA
ncbi:hypothetical protein NDU88_004170 [Pleurodeles waltl]|uniref:Uncharacterized protein n=1 Tax=Pleurodeles waltl TaxID=8319 RepID=A0AAV7V0I5_PLEWA|nr:hypothetical protein NDU88_004170 [Pleurodeles waltl]